MQIFHKIKNKIHFIKYKMNKKSLSYLYYEILRINKKINIESYYKYSEHDEKYIKEKINLMLKVIEIADFYHPNYKNYYTYYNDILIKNLTINNFENFIDNFNKTRIIKRILYANKAKKLINKIKSRIDKKIA